jgi:hypothetical protein
VKRTPQNDHNSPPSNPTSLVTSSRLISGGRFDSFVDRHGSARGRRHKLTGQSLQDQFVKKCVRFQGVERRWHAYQRLSLFVNSDCDPVSFLVTVISGTHKEFDDIVEGANGDLPSDT